MMKYGLPAPCLLAVMLGACTTQDAHYPSLALRPTEKIGFEEPTRHAAAPIVADPVLDAKMADAGKELDRLSGAFAAAANDAEKAANAARRTPAGGDAWLNAQTSLAGLDDLHAQTSSLVSDVEQLAIDRAATLEPGYPGLTRLAGRVTAESKQQGETIARLAAMLAPA